MFEKISKQYQPRKIIVSNRFVLKRLNDSKISNFKIYLETILQVYFYLYNKNKCKFLQYSPS